MSTIQECNRDIMFNQIELSYVCWIGSVFNLIYRSVIYKCIKYNSINGPNDRNCKKIIDMFDSVTEPNFYPYVPKGVKENYFKLSGLEFNPKFYGNAYKFMESILIYCGMSYRIGNAGNDTNFKVY